MCLLQEITAGQVACLIKKQLHGKELFKEPLLAFSMRPGV